MTAGFINPLESPEVFNEYILIFANYSKLEQDSNLNLISFEDSKIERNRIYRNLLALIDKLNE